MSDTSLREFARRLKVTDRAVRKAIASGRLLRSVGRTAKNRPVIVDVPLARREWRQNAGKVGASSSVTLAAAQRALSLERARGLKLANDLKGGTLIDAALAARQAFEASRSIRDNVLNIPARLAAELAAESDANRVHARLDAELRLALEASAKALAS